MKRRDKNTHMELKRGDAALAYVSLLLLEVCSASLRRRLLNDCLVQGP